MIQGQGVTLRTMWNMARGKRLESRRRLVDFIVMFNDSEMTMGRALRYVQTGIIESSDGDAPGSSDTEMPPAAMVALKKTGWI